jgi:hypothetical protein
LPDVVEKAGVVIGAVDWSRETVASIAIGPTGDVACLVKLTAVALAPLMVTDWQVG